MKNIVTFYAPLLALLVMLFGAVDPAAAHPNHKLGSPSAVQAPVPSQSVVASAERRTQVSVVAALSAPAQQTGPADKSPQPTSQEDCCCGSIVCHAGLASADAGGPVLTLMGRKLRPPPLRHIVVELNSGLERPPKRA